MDGVDWSALLISEMQQNLQTGPLCRGRILAQALALLAALFAALPSHKNRSIIAAKISAQMQRKTASTLLLQLLLIDATAMAGNCCTKAKQQARECSYEPS